MRSRFVPHVDCLRVCSDYVINRVLGPRWSPTESESESETEDEERELLVETFEKALESDGFRQWVVNSVIPPPPSAYPTDSFGLRFAGVLGKGNNSRVYLGHLLSDDEEELVFKTSVLVDNDSKKCDRLSNTEATLLQHLSGSPRFCALKFHARNLGTVATVDRDSVTAGLDVCVLGLAKLGPNLMGDTLPLDIVLEVGAQLVEGLRDLHRLGYVHTGIKPENLCWRAKRPTSRAAVDVVILDLERAEPYLKATSESNKLEHVPDKQISWPLFGDRTGMFMGVHLYRSKTTTRMDDLEAVYWVMVALLAGGLPWRPTDCRKDRVWWLKQQHPQQLGAMLSSLNSRSQPPLHGEDGLGKLACYLAQLREMDFGAEPPYNALLYCLRSE